jgi:hypothetical protein
VRLDKINFDLGFLEKLGERKRVWPLSKGNPGVILFSIDPGNQQLEVLFSPTEKNSVREENDFLRLKHQPFPLH